MKMETAGIEEKETTTAARSASGATSELVQEIGIERVVADPEQPRKVFDLGALQGLAESIQEQGIVQPLIARAGDWFMEAGRQGKEEGWFLLNREWLRPKGVYLGPDLFYKTESEAKGVLANARPVVLVAGERRLRAAKLAGLKSVPCIVRSYPDGAKNVFGVQMVENLQRENLSALEEAAALGKQVEKGRKAEELAKELGVSRATVFAKLRLNGLSEPVKTELLRGNITGSVAGLIAMVPAEVQTKFLKEVTSNHGFDGVMSYRRAEELLERNYARQLGKASFDTKAEYAWEKGMQPRMDTNKHESGKKAVTCEGCPRRSGNMEGSGLKNGNVCTQPICFEFKTKAAGALKAELARKQGRTVLEGKEGAKLFSEYGDEEVQHGSGFVELDRRADVLGWEEKKTYRDVLGHNLVGGKGVAEMKVVVAIDREGRARELVAREEAVKVLKECGKIKPEKPSASDAKWERQRKAEEEKRQRVKAQAKAAQTELVLTASRPVKEMDAKFLQKLCLLAFDVANVDDLEKRRGPKLRQAKGATHREKFRDYVMNGLHGAEENLVGLLVDCLVTPDVRYDGNLGEGFQEALDLFGVKLEKLPARAKGEKPKTKEGKAAEDSRSPKPGGGSKVLPGRGESKQKGAKKKGKSRK